MNRTKRRLAIVSVMALIGALGVGTNLGAQTPGTDGQIYFMGSSDVHSINGGTTTHTSDTGKTSVDVCHTDISILVFEDHNDTTPGIYVRNGTTETHLTGTDAGDFNPVFNQDCTQVAFEDRTSGSEGIRKSILTSAGGSASGPPTSVLGGTGPGCCGDPTDHGHAPEWSPTGSLIYFHADAQSTALVQNQIFSVSSGGGSASPTAIVTGSGDCGPDAAATEQSCQYPSISPNGATLAFDRGDPTGTDREIWTAPVSSGDGVKHPDSDKTVADDLTPDWSPQGTRIVADVAGDGLVILDVPDSGTRTTRNPRAGDETRPDWAKAAPSATPTATPTGAPTATPDGGTPTPDPGTGNITGTTFGSGGGGGFFGFFFFGFGGGPVPTGGVTVRVVSTDQSDTSDSSGDYAITNVPAGSQRLRATMQSMSLFSGSTTVRCTEEGTDDRSPSVVVPDQGSIDVDWTCPSGGGGGFFGIFSGFPFFSFFPLFGFFG